MLKRMRIGEVNPYIICVLCGGYLVDATTIVECLHSFCRSCIVKYLYASFHCPVCDAEVHKTKPLLHIRSDPTLQDIVYKLVPGLYYGELGRRKGAGNDQQKEVTLGGQTETENHKGVKENEKNEADKENEEDNENKESVKDKEENEENTEKSDIQMDDPMFVTLEYYRMKRNRAEQEIFPTRYLRCPSAVTVSVLKKFLVMKFTIPPSHQPEIIRCDEIIDPHLTIKEVSQIYGLYAKSFLDVQYAFLDVQVPKAPIVRRNKKQKSHHVKHSAAAETFSKTNEVSVGNNSPNGFLARPAVGRENGMKPTLSNGTEEYKTKELIKIGATNDKQTFLHSEPTLPSSFASLKTDPSTC